MAAKKKPSAAQLAARAKFVAMVRAKSKAKKSATKKATVKKSAPKKATKKASTHKDTKSHNVNIRVVSGTKKKAVAKKKVSGLDKQGSLTSVNLAVRKIGSLQTDKIKKSIDWINFYNKELNFWKSFNPGIDKNYKKQKIDSIKFYRKSLIEEKKHFTQLKKLL